MSMMVQTSTDDTPELLAIIERRRANGLDRHDEWWEGVYRIVTGPTPEHQRLVMALATLLIGRLSDDRLEVLPSVNIGDDKHDARVPDLAVLATDTPRTSPAFLATARLVAEVLSPGERPGEKLPFYARWNVDEYLELDPQHGTARLLGRASDRWRTLDRSGVVDFTLDDVLALLPPR